MSKKQYEILWKDNIPYRLRSGMTFAFLYYLVDIQFIEIKAGTAHISMSLELDAEHTAAAADKFCACNLLELESCKIGGIE